MATPLVTKDCYNGERTVELQKCRATSVNMEQSALKTEERTHTSASARLDLPAHTVKERHVVITTRNTLTLTL